MAKGNQKIVRYRRPRSFNIGAFIFLAIFAYMTFYVYKYITKEKIQPYEVTEGAIVNNKKYTGIILRNETTAYLDTTGYINYYIREGKRAAAGTSIYSVDESGTLAAIVKENGLDQTALADEDLLTVKKHLSNYSLSYSDQRFSDIYDIKYSLEALVLEYANFYAMESQEQVIQQLGGNFKQVQTPISGVISYAVDSYEDLTVSQISEEVFDRTNYSRGITKAGQLMEQGSPIYKVVTDDTWSLVFPMSQEDEEQFGAEPSLRVSFSGANLTTTGNLSVIKGADGKTYGKLDFSKYMVQFVSERYLDFEIITSAAEGLKIPISSVINKNFYLVPVSFLTTGGDSLENGFNKEVYSESGTSIVFVPTTIYYSSDEYYYIDIGEGGEIQAGDYLVKPGSTDRYQVGPSASLQGVYNINRGYTVFKQIEVLAQSDEFYTVKKGTSYGLNVYDHIVLDGSLIEKEGVLIYQ